MSRSPRSRSRLARKPALAGRAVAWALVAVTAVALPAAVWAAWRSGLSRQAEDLAAAAPSSSAVAALDRIEAGCPGACPSRVTLAAAVARLKLATVTAPGAARITLLEQAGARLDRAAALQPDNADVPTWKLYAAVLDDRPQALAVAPDLLRESWRRAPFDRRVAQWRLTLATANWAGLPADLRRRALDEGAWLIAVAPRQADAIYAGVGDPAAAFALRLRVLRSAEP